MGRTILDRPLVLTGLPGAGKTTVGRIVAARLGLPFVDGDAEVERTGGGTVADLWTRDGEAGFRALERGVMLDLIEASGPRVIAAGGGALLDQDVRRLADERACVAWLQAPVDVLAERVRAGPPRPVLGEDVEAALGRLESARAAVYAEAALPIPFAPGPPERTADAVLRALGA